MKDFFIASCIIVLIAICGVFVRRLVDSDQESTESQPQIYSSQTMIGGSNSVMISGEGDEQDGQQVPESGETFPAGTYHLNTPIYCQSSNGGINEDGEEGSIVITVNNPMRCFGK